MFLHADDNEDLAITTAWLFFWNRWSKKQQNKFKKNIMYSYILELMQHEELYWQWFMYPLQSLFDPFTDKLCYDIWLEFQK